MPCPAPSSPGPVHDVTREWRHTNCGNVWELYPTIPGGVGALYPTIHGGAGQGVPCPYGTGFVMVCVPVYGVWVDVRAGVTGFGPGVLVYGSNRWMPL